MKFTLVLLSLFVLFSCQDNKKQNKVDLSLIDTTLVVDTASIDSSYIEPKPESNWTYSEKEDKMTGEVIKYAELLSENTLQFNSPYNGGSLSTLVIRKQRGELNIFVSVKPSQMIFDYDNEFVKVRFDKSSMKSYSILKPADGSSDVFFFANEKAILKKLKESEKMLIELTFYNEGNRIIEFNTRNLKF